MNQEKTVAQPEIKQLRSATRGGVVGLSLFTAVSVGALFDFRFLPPIPQGARETLGGSPPAVLIHIALVVYTFSALIIILARLEEGPTSYRGWSHLAYLSAFYGFYFYGGYLRENFWAVFMSGLTILCLESYRVTSCCREAIRKAEGSSNADR